jgi:Flagellar hook capping protein
VVDKGDDGLDRNAFLTLLTTQLQNQNPLDPMENEAFVAQLAQFSQLEATTQMSTSLESMAAQQRGDRILAGASLVGQQVLAETGLVKVNGESGASMELELPTGADQVEFGIYDVETSQKLRDFVVGPQTAGQKTFNWDGRLANGEFAPEGTYTVRAAIVQGTNSTPVVPMTMSPVRSIGWDAATSDLNVNFDGDVSLPLSEISRVGR